MQRVGVLLSLLFCIGDLYAFVRPIVMSKGNNQTLKVPGLLRVAVGDGKIVKAKDLGSGVVLLTAKEVGHTMVRVWERSGKESEYPIRVISSVAAGQESEGRSGVVKVSLEFLELDMGLSSDTGIHWPEQIQFSAFGTLQGASAMNGINYSVSFASAKGWISHLVKRGWARLIANPEMYVRLGEEVQFHSGGEFPVSTGEESYGRYHKKVEWKPWGITAKVKPNSLDQVHFTSDVQLEISEINLSNAVDGVPGLTRRKITTKMNAVDGQTVILSGLYKQAESTVREGLPILSEIPLIGSLLFGTRARRSEETELLMSVTFTMTSLSRERDAQEGFKKRFQIVGED